MFPLCSRRFADQSQGEWQGQALSKVQNEGYGPQGEALAQGGRRPYRRTGRLLQIRIEQERKAHGLWLGPDLRSEIFLQVIQDEDVVLRIRLGHALFFLHPE